MNNDADATRHDRERNYVEARASVMLEGGKSSSGLEALATEYINGQLSLEQFVSKGLAFAKTIKPDCTNAAD